MDKATTKFVVSFRIISWRNNKILSRKPWWCESCGYYDHQLIHEIAFSEAVDTVDDYTIFRCRNCYGLDVERLKTMTMSSIVLVKLIKLKSLTKHNKQVESEQLI